MLLAGHFTFPLAARTSVASDGIIKSATPTHRAVTQHHYMSVVGFHAVQKPCLSQIKSVPDHDGCRAIESIVRPGLPRAVQARLRVIQRLYKPGRSMMVLILIGA